MPCAADWFQSGEVVINVLAQTGPTGSNTASAHRKQPMRFVLPTGTSPVRRGKQNQPHRPGAALSRRTLTGAIQPHFPPGALAPSPSRRQGHRQRENTRCGANRAASVLNASPKSSSSRRGTLLHEIWSLEITICPDLTEAGQEHLISSARLARHKPGPALHLLVLYDKTDPQVSQRENRFAPHARGSTDKANIVTSVDQLKA